MTEQIDQVTKALDALLYETEILGTTFFTNSHTQTKDQKIITQCIAVQCYIQDLQELLSPLLKLQTKFTLLFKDFNNLNKHDNNQFYWDWLFPRARRSLLLRLNDLSSNLQDQLRLTSFELKKFTSSHHVTFSLVLGRSRVRVRRESKTGEVRFEEELPGQFGKVEREVVRRWDKEGGESLLEGWRTMLVEIEEAKETLRRSAVGDKDRRSDSSHRSKGSIFEVKNRRQ